MTWKNRNLCTEPEVRFYKSIMSHTTMVVAKTRDYTSKNKAALENNSNKGKVVPVLN
jgi:hypothetical protein